MKKFFIFFIFSFLQQVVAQQIPAEYQLSPAGLLETNFDHYGTSYPLANLQIGATTNYTVVQAGIFDIYYAANSGMEGNSTANSQKRNVINKVFSDLSDFLDTPLKTIPNAPKIKIWIQNFTAVQSHAYNDIAYGTSFYNVPKNMGTAAIADNQLWQMINSGKAPYHKVTFSVNDNNQPLSFFHAAFAFNPALNWNTSLGYAPYANQYDLYTFALREAVHALGVNSLIAQNGTSRFGANYNYYSRFDTFLKNKNNVALIANTQGCSFTSGYGFNGNLSDLGTNCNNNDNASPCGKTNYFAGTNTLKLVTPNCYNPLVTSLFVNTNCNENLDNNWLLDRALRKGDMQRYLNPYERQLLVDLGYGFARTFGKNSRLNHINYNRTATSHAVVGVNDGFDSLGNTLYTTVNQPLALPNLVANDKSATNFECLQDLTDAVAVFSATTGTASTSATFTTTIKGKHLLSYIPYNASTGKRGNRTYVSVNVLKFDCPVDPDPCNLVLNGGFEIYDHLEGRAALNEACGWKQTGTADHFHSSILDVTSGIPDNHMFAGFQGAITSPFINNGGSSNAYAGIVSEWNTYPTTPGSFEEHRYREIISGTLLPLTPNTRYELTIDVSLAELYQNRQTEIQVLLTDSMTPLIPSAFDDLDPQTIPNSKLLRSVLQPQLISDTVNWTTLHFTFDSGTWNFKHLHIGSLFNAAESNQDIGVGSYYYIDNVVLREANPTLNIQPESLCANDPCLDLSTMLTGGTTSGVFSGPGVTGTTFNPATAGVGTHTITYTIPSPIACPAIVVTDTITVNSCLPAQPPYISQVYYNGADRFVEVKNISDLQPINPTNYYLALYENNEATNVAPTKFIDLGSIPPQGVKVWKAQTGGTLGYVTATDWADLNNYNGVDDIVILTTTIDANAYANRIDEFGKTNFNAFHDNITLQQQASFVRMSCAPAIPTPVYNQEHWVYFTTAEVGNSSSLTNAELGRHYDKVLIWMFTNTWNEQDIIDPIFPALPFNESLPDRSRSIYLISNYNTSTYGSFEACSVKINSFKTLTINPNTYVKVFVGIDATETGAKLIVEDKGSLVMVYDCYNSTCGINLIQTGSTSPMLATKTTVGLNSPYDYVYLSSPLAVHPLSNTAGQLLAANSNHGAFNPNRFYLFENKNFCNIVNTYDGTKPLDVYDDNFNDYMPINQIPNALNEPLIPGRGYASWPPTSTTMTGTNYSIEFEGVLNNGEVKVPVYKNNSQLGINSNLVGNPYPSAIDLDLFFTANQGKILPAAYIWTRIQHSTNGDPEPLNGPHALNYDTFNFSVYYSGISGSNTYEVVLNPDSLGAFGGGRVLSSGQSFFVNTPKNFTGFTMPAPVAPVANHSPIYGNYGYGVPYPQEEIVVSDTIVFKNKMRTIALNNTFSKTAQPKNSTARSTSEMSRINLKLSDNTSFDVLAAVVFKEDGQATFNEMEDVVTMGGRKYNLYTQSTPKDLIIDVQNGFSIDKIIPLGVLNNSDQAQISLTLSLQEANGIFASQNVYVYDTLTNQVHNLSQSFYTFTTQGAVNENRLYLVFTQTIPTFESRVSQEEAVRIVIKEGKLQIEATKQNIKSVEATDIYSFGKVFPFANKNNVNAKIYQENIPTNTHLIYIKVVLEDGTVISKKIKK